MSTAPGVHLPWGRLLLAALVLATALPAIAVTIRTVEGQQPPSFAFGALGDLGASGDTTATLDTLAASGTGFSLALGDLSYRNLQPESAWCEYIQSRLGATYPFELVGGNHEDNGPDGLLSRFAACLPHRLGGLTGTYGQEYYFDHPATTPLARVIMISPHLVYPGGDPYEYVKGNAHYSWMAGAVDGARAAGIPWVIVGMHRNCITMGVKPCDIGPDLQNLLIQKKVDLILQAHEHSYQRSKQLALGRSCPEVLPGDFDPGCVADDGAGGLYEKGAGSVIVISGSAGRRLYPLDRSDPEAGYFARWMGSNSEPRRGFVRFEVSAEKIEARFVPSTPGTFADSFTIRDTRPQTLTFAPTDDATVRQDLPNTNFGAEPALMADASPNLDFVMKFSVSGMGTRGVAGAKIRLYNMDGSSRGGDFYRVATTWTQGTVSWGNSPASGPGMIRSLGAVSSGSWYEVDVSSLITGDGTYAFRVTGPSDNRAMYASKEGGPGQAPQLVVTLGPSAPTPTTSTLSFAPTDDASIKPQFPDANFGALGTVQTDADPEEDFLIKFVVSGVGTRRVTGATVRLYATDGSVRGGDFYPVPSTWSEETVTWNRAPRPASPMIGSLGAVSPGNWYEVDVSPLLTGDGTYSFRVDNPARDGADYASKEKAQAPQLVVTLAP